MIKGYRFKPLSLCSKTQNVLSADMRLKKFGILEHAGFQIFGLVKLNLYYPAILVDAK
jgi:hypothetical protein